MRLLCTQWSNKHVWLLKHSQQEPKEPDGQERTKLNAEFPLTGSSRNGEIFLNVEYILHVCDKNYNNWFYIPGLVSSHNSICSTTFLNKVFIPLHTS